MERVVKEMQSDPNAKVRLTELQARHLREKLEGVSSFLKDHPALRERRLFISPTKPEFPMPSRIMSDVTFSSGVRSLGTFENNGCRFEYRDLYATNVTSATRPKVVGLGVH